jgi:hypothetical protein
VLKEFLQYPGTLPQDVHIGVAVLLNQIAVVNGVVAELPPKTFIIRVLPYKLVTETDAVWVNLLVSGWVAQIDLTPFFYGRASTVADLCCEYVVEVVIYHVHGTAAVANLNCGHYVAYVKQAGQWHLANDNAVGVSPVLVRGLPYVWVLERMDAPGDNLQPQSAGMGVEMDPVEISEAEDVAVSTASSGDESPAVLPRQASKSCACDADVSLPHLLGSAPQLATQIPIRKRPAAASHASTRLT